MVCWQMGKTSRKTKTPLGEFKVTTPKNPLIKNQAVRSMRNLIITLAYSKILTYSWTFASIPSWTWSYSKFLCFTLISNLWLILLHGSQYVLTPATWLIIDGCKALHFINDEYQARAALHPTQGVQMNPLAWPEKYIYNFFFTPKIKFWTSRL